MNRIYILHIMFTIHLVEDMYSLMNDAHNRRCYNVSDVMSIYLVMLNLLKLLNIVRFRYTDNSTKVFLYIIHAL